MSQFNPSIYQEQQSHSMENEQPFIQNQPNYNKQQRSESQQSTPKGQRLGLRQKRKKVLEFENNKRLINEVLKYLPRGTFTYNFDYRNLKNKMQTQNQNGIQINWKQIARQLMVTKQSYLIKRYQKILNKARQKVNSQIYLSDRQILQKYLDDNQKYLQLNKNNYFQVYKKGPVKTCKMKKKVQVLFDKICDSRSGLSILLQKLQQKNNKNFKKSQIRNPLQNCIKAYTQEIKNMEIMRQELQKNLMHIQQE